ncbi:MAG: glycosyltransferase family 39 protein [Candidatus Levyibacteriota bacterium]
MKINLNPIVKKVKALLINKRARWAIFFFLLVLIVFLSIFPRAVEVLNNNPIFGFDQGREMLAAKNIVVNHKLILIGTEVGAGVAGISGVFHGPIYYYMLTIPFILFNGNPQGGIYLMFLFGLASIVFGYYFGKKLFGRWGGMLLALLISISPLFIAQSRFIWSPNPPTLFILLSLWFTYLLKEKKSIYIFLAAFFAAFVYNFELGIAVPLSLTLLIYCVFLLRRDLKKLLYLFAGFILGYLPMILFEVRHNFLGTRGIISYILSHKAVASSHPGSYYLLDHVKSFINYFQGTFPTNSWDSLILALIIIFSLYFLIKEKNIAFKHFFSFLLLLIPVTFFVFSPLRNTVYGIYLQHLDIAYLLLFCYIIYSFINKKLKLLFIASLIFIMVMTLLGLRNAIKVSLYDYSDYGGTAKIKGKIDAIDYIYKDAKGKPFGLLVFAPGVYTYPYDYLLWWYGQRKYHYIPYGEKKGTFYLLIETDPYQPWSYKGWLETVIKTGNIVYTKTLPSGFIVQKRVN